MASNRDQETTTDAADSGTIATESTAYHSDLEKAEPRMVDEGAVGDPDSDHEEVEQMDFGHLDDLARQRVRIYASPENEHSLT